MPRKLRSSAPRLLGHGDSLWVCENISARYAAVSFSWSRRPSVPNPVWWNFPDKMSTYGRAQTHIMFRCWILHLPLCLLWQTHNTSLLLAFSFIRLSLFHFRVKEKARLLQPLRGFFCWVGYSQITGDMCYQMMFVFTLGLRMHVRCTFRNEWTTRWTYHFFYLC